MRKVVLLAAGLMIAAGVCVEAADVRGAGPGGYYGPGGLQKGAYAQGLARFLPGAYAFLDRVELNADQEKVIEEVYTQWSQKYSSAYTAVSKKLKALTAEEAKDPEKMKAWQAKYAELMKEEQGEIPLDKISNLLTPEQLGKILEVGTFVVAWNKWLAEYMAKYEKKVDEVLGPVPQGVDPRSTVMKYYILEGYTKGASALGCRLGLTKEQDAALEELAKTGRAESMAAWASAGPMFRVDGGWSQDMFALQSVITGRTSTDVTEKNRGAIEKILTEDQRGRLARCVSLIAERDKDVWQGYTEYIAKVDKVLPPAKGKAGAAVPYGAYGAGGGMWR